MGTPRKLIKPSSTTPRPSGLPLQTSGNCKSMFFFSPRYISRTFSVSFIAGVSSSHLQATPQSDAFLSYLTIGDDHLPARPTHRQGPRDGFRGGSKEKHTIPVLRQRTSIFQCFKQHAHWTESQMAIPLQRSVPFPPWGTGRAYRHQAPHPRDGSTSPRHS